VCLTPENLSSPWVLYEAGSIAKGVSASRVVPYRFGLTASDVPYPLAQFQGVDADEDGTRKLVKSINATLDPPMEDARVERVFSLWWPVLQAKLRDVTQVISEVPKRGDREILEEILDHMREMSNTSRSDWAGTSVPRSAVWKTVHEVYKDDLERMTDQEIEKYISQVNERWHQASGGESDALESKTWAAQQFLNNRKKGN
jgi:hypothetical protein